MSKRALTQSSNNIELLIQYSNFLQQQPELPELLAENNLSNPIKNNKY